VVDVVAEIPRLGTREPARSGLGDREDRRQIEPPRLAVIGRARAQQLDLADQLVERSRAELCELLADAPGPGSRSRPSTC
jgi:hypothetical protein